MAYYLLVDAMKTKFKKEMRDWGIIAVVFLTLYLTGLHTDVAAFAQRMILYTGILAPETDLDESEFIDADMDFEIKNLDGDEVVNLNDFKGKVVFMNIWATWCAPCIAEMPNIQSLHDKLKEENNDDVVFVMLSMDRSEEKARKFIKKKGFTFPTYVAASKVPDVFNVPSIPTTFVISPEGKIVSKKVGMANYDKKKFKSYLEGLTTTN